MELYKRICAILCLLCVARASEEPPRKITGFNEGPLAYVDLSRIQIQKADGQFDEQFTDKSRDKRALGLLLSGLAQIFGYTVTPIQFASLPNPSTARPAAVANSSMMGHLRQYEQMFHGSRNSTMTPMMTTSRPKPAPMPIPPAKLSIDPRTNTQTKPPLLAPFFVKIPLPIAPELLPAVPIEDLGLSYPNPVSIASGSKEETETPVRKEQETVYRSNEDTERYTVEDKDIYDEKDVKKPMDKYTHQLYVDDPRWKKQQEERTNELLRKQEERVEKLKQQEKERNCNKTPHHSEEERNERYRNREEEIDNRNRDYVPKHETEERRPVYIKNDDEVEGSAERSREHVDHMNLSNEPSKRPPKKEEIEDYPSYDDDSNKQFNGYKQENLREPENFDKYVEVYNQQLPIGDYFHEGNPEVLRDSYGEVLDNKKLKDDRIAGYISMFKQPYVPADPYDSQRAHPEDASREETEKETSAEDGYDEHLVRLQKLREEYALPENKYEEYDINDEGEADRDDRESERIQNRTSVRSGRPKTGRFRGEKENSRTRTPTGSNGNEATNGLRTRDDDAARSEKTREEVNFARYVPLVVPIRYIDVNDKLQQATTRQLNYKKADKSTDSRFSEDNVDPQTAISKEKLTPLIGLPMERPRQLHEGEHKELQIWPPPFDYAYDNTEPAKTIVPPNLQDGIYAPNYYQYVVKNIATQDAKDKSSEQPSGYVVVVGNPTYPYRYPYNIYYFSNEAVGNSQNQVPRANAEVTHPRDQVYVARQSANRQFVQVKPNLTEYNLNETAKSPHGYYQPQEVPTNVLDRYRYTLGERTHQAGELVDNIDIRTQIPNTENWSNRIYRPPDNRVEQSPHRPIFAQLQNIASLNVQNVQRGPLQRPRLPQLLRRRRNVQPEDGSENDEEAEVAQPKNKPFDDPQSAHDFFGFSKDDYSFGSESSDATKENGKTAGEESDEFVSAEPIAYHHDDESTKHIDEAENDMEKAKVREYRNKVATLRVSERRQLKPNGPIHYIDFIRNI
ncbi:uncharacterized protein LOC105430443 isoform X2 [Pogonomyrmex barbatus]|uniref:Uncharacterized protein LOC105430443 isoform X2 n=1 Tax=Pogonomyrmex barbatus TaxID=144034 RepID=A0A6I9XBT5_9HYME|nr:uncharacterized protein LOC105430443 isoform X2 [Pogonomyrmex barbatus]